MKWKTHIRITQEVVHKLKIPLSHQNLNILKEGALAPDIWKDYPHHYGKSSQIREYLVKARGFFLKGDLYNACYHLGVALHYIQDSHTSFASFYPNHESWEQQIEDSHYSHNLEQEIHYYLSDNGYERNRCLGLCNALSVEIEGKESTLQAATLSGYEASKSFAKPFIDFNLGLKASYAVTKSIFSPKNKPELDANLFRVLKEHEDLLQSAEILASTEIAKRVEQKEELISRISKNPGLAIKLKNLFLRIRVGFKGWTLNRRVREYYSQRHLQKVESKYYKTVNNTVSPYQEWYNYQIQKINFGVVENELLDVQVIAKNLGIETDKLKAMMGINGFLTINIDNRELIKRSELNKALEASAPNRVTKYQF